MSVLTRLKNVFRSGPVESELDEELQFHLEERIRELTASGMPREEAGARRPSAGSVVRSGGASRAATSS